MAARGEQQQTAPQLCTNDIATAVYVLAKTLSKWYLGARVVRVTPTLKCVEKYALNRSVYISIATPGMKHICTRNYWGELIHWLSTVPRCVSEYEMGVGIYAEIRPPAIEAVGRRRGFEKKLAGALRGLGKKYPVLRRFLEALVSDPRLCESGEVTLIDYEKVGFTEAIYVCPSIGFLHVLRGGDGVVYLFYSGFR